MVAWCCEQCDTKVGSASVRGRLAGSQGGTVSVAMGLRSCTRAFKVKKGRTMIHGDCVVRLHVDKVQYQARRFAQFPSLEMRTIKAIDIVQRYKYTTPPSTTVLPPQTYPKAQQYYLAPVSAHSLAPYDPG
jgi:hypothetical protein